MIHFLERETQKSYEFQYLTKAMDLEEGYSFGELALMSKKPEKRAATVICSSELCHLAILDKKDF